MKIFKVIPKLEKPRHLALWHKAQESQWSARAIDWDAPQGISSPQLKDKLAKVLTPVLMSEQSAFHSASALMPLLAKNHEVESQYYLASWLVDEARHAELFARMFQRLDREPLSTRRFPGAYLFQSRIISDDPAIWLAGLLVVEVLAKKVMQEFNRIDLDPALSQISEGILGDETRHLGFNRVYIEDRIAELHAGGAAPAKAFAERLTERMEQVIDYAPSLFESLKPELAAIGFQVDTVLDTLPEESRSRLRKSIGAGERIAAERAEGAALG